MAFQLSPGVEINEIDLTTIVPAVATTKAGFAGIFEWGPVGQRITVESENALVSTFRKPNNNNYPYWFTAANYLGYGRDLQVVRVTDSSSKNATDTGLGFSIVRNTGELPDKLTQLESDGVVFLAKYPGALGNALAVSISDKTDSQAEEEGGNNEEEGGGGEEDNGGSEGGGGGPGISYTYETINRVFSRAGLDNNARDSETGLPGPRGTAKFAIDSPDENWSDLDRICVNTFQGEVPDSSANPPTYPPDHHYIYLPVLPNTMIPPSTHGRNFDSTRVGRAGTINNKYGVTRVDNFPTQIESPMPKAQYDEKVIAPVDPLDAADGDASRGLTGTVFGDSHVEPMMLYLDIRELNPDSIHSNLDYRDDYYDLPSWNGSPQNATYNTRRASLENILYHAPVDGQRTLTEINKRRSQIFLAGDDGAWPENKNAVINGGAVFNILNENGLNYVHNGRMLTPTGPNIGSVEDNVYDAIQEAADISSTGGSKPKFLSQASLLQYYLTNTRIGFMNGTNLPNPPMVDDLSITDGWVDTVINNGASTVICQHPNVRHPDTNVHLNMDPDVAAFVSIITGIPDTGNFPEFYADPNDPTTWNGEPVPRSVFFQDFQADTTVMSGPREAESAPGPQNIFADANNWDYAPTTAAYVNEFDRMPIFSGKIKGAAELQTIVGEGAMANGESVFAFLPEIFESTGIHGGDPGNQIGFAKVPRFGFKYYEGRPAIYSKPEDFELSVGGVPVTVPAGSGRLGTPSVAPFEQLSLGADPTIGGRLIPGEKTWFSICFNEGGFGLAKGDINYEYKMPFFSSRAGDPASITDPASGEVIYGGTRVNRFPLMLAGHFHVNRNEDELPGASGLPSDGDGRVTIIEEQVNVNQDNTFAPPSANIVNDDGTWRYAGLFETSLPASSSFADRFNVGNDLMHMVVYDKTGDVTGTVGTVLERFSSMSKAPNAKKFDGTNNYYKDVINENSKWISIAKTPGTTAPGIPLDTVIDSEIADGSYASVGTKDYTLGGGTDVLPAGGDLYTNGYDQFADPQTVDISLILGGPTEGIQSKQIIEMCDRRKDAVAFVSPAKTAVLTSTGSPKSSAVATANNIAYRKGTNANSSGGDTDYSGNNTNVSSSYGFLDSGWKYMYDRYNDVFRFVPLNGDVAGLAARSDDVAEPWFSPAGFNRGQVRNVVKLAFNPVQTQRDNLYSSQINSVCSFPGEGTVLFGDKTLQSKPSAFDRLNVRRLFIVLEKAIATAAKFQLFEQNDAFTRASFRQLIEPFLRDVQSRRGIIDFKVVCDESNNTGEVIDRNEFVADIFIKPTRSINYITLNFIATRTDVSFDEIGGSA